MRQVVTITRQGQLTIPQSVRSLFCLQGSTKALLRTEGHRIIVEPQGDFRSLSGSLKSRVKLTDAQLKKARATFAKTWSKIV